MMSESDEPISFDSLGLPPELTSAIEALGFEEPSPIQAAAIPLAMTGVDIVGLSETGSGKTAAFVLPALARVDFERKQTQVLIVCPTRELSVQVCTEVHRLGEKVDRMRAIPVYGGAPFDRQEKQLRSGVQVVVGTPGRLLDHLRRGSLDPSGIGMAVLDEADRMLDMGFIEEVATLLGELPEDRQTLFFSATMKPDVVRLIDRFGNDPQTIEIERKQMTVESIEQICFEVRERSKVEVISRLVDMEQPRLTLVFCNTKRSVDDVTEALLGRGYAADRLHGDITQALRERVMRRFRDGSVELLVATDVAARGLDVDDVDLVINYDLPQDPEDYVHRVGRTGRAGRDGKAISFIFGRDRFRLRTIERFTGERIPKGKIPSPQEVDGKLSDHLFDSLRERIEGGDLDEAEERLEKLQLDGFEIDQIAAAAIALLKDSVGRDSQEIVEDKPRSERPAKGRRRPDQEDQRDAVDSGPRDREERRERRPHPADRREGREGRDDRGPRDRPARKPEADARGMVSLFINAGKAIGLSPKDIAGMLYNQAKLPKGSVGRINIGYKHSTVEVEAEVAEKALSVADSTQLKGKDFRIDYDRGRPPEGKFRRDRDRSDRGRDDRRERRGGNYRGKRN
ncbi:MAG: DEAD/DEAH box helicase [Verrucomicrobiota bacterium]